MSVYIIDNYDSFTYNLVDLFYKENIQPIVIPHDQTGAKLLNANHILLSPGPGSPKDAGISMSVLKRFYKTTPILGVCLGHQVMGEFFGSNVVHAKEVMHGKVSLIYHKEQGLFKGLPSPFKAVRYHSLVIDSIAPSQDIEITAWTEKNGQMDEIMAFQHKSLPLFGVQFHPESILSEYGQEILHHFLEI